MIQITVSVLHDLKKHAEETYPSECCGFLIGPKNANTFDAIYRCENLQDALHAKDPDTYPRTSKTAYSLSSKDIFFLDRSQRTERPIGIIYHSHNDVGAYFSAEDKAFALFAGEPAYPVDYLVIDTRAGQAKEAKLFRFDTHLADFAEIARYALEDSPSAPLD